MSYKIEQISSEDLQRFTNLSTNDRELIDQFKINSTFNSQENFIELNFLSEDNELLLSDSNFKNIKVLSGALTSNTGESSVITINPEEDIKQYLFDGNNIKLLYYFLNNVYSKGNSINDFIIDSISSDRSEVRLLPFELNNDNIEERTTELNRLLTSESFIQDLSLYFQNNNFESIVNIKPQVIDDTLYVVVKLYTPLNEDITTNTKVSVVEQLNNPVAFSGIYEIEEERSTRFRLRGPNFSIQTDQDSNEQSELLNLDELFSIDINNSTNQINSLLNEKSALISIDYSNYSDFINFSSVAERLYNFKYKLQLLEKYNLNLQQLNSGQSNEISNSKKYFEDLIQGIINNFDHYERFLYYENKESAWPKVSTDIPYENATTTSTVASNWFQENIEAAQVFDNSNYNALINTIPTFLKDSHDNAPFITFVNMIGHHFDNLWIYTKAVTDKYNADNRLDRGISKDLIEEVLNSFGVKIYSSSKSIEDLFRYFTQDSYDPEGEQINTEIQVGEQVSQKDYQKEIYKRIYHNLPLLLKAKGTERGVKALINCFGIPSNILQVKYFGGQDTRDTPFFGGEQSLTSSLSKIRIDNTGSIVEGETLSQYTSIQKDSKNYTEDLHKVDIGFSPSTNVDDYLIRKLDKDFKIDDFIGDPRKGANNHYPNLDKLSKLILSNLDTYNTKDFVRLIKFFDNVIFKMVKDFIPARTVSSTGVIIKPHLLDRSKGVEPVMTFTQELLTGSIDTAFITGSHGNSFNSGSTEYSTNYINIVQTPEGKTVKKWEGSNNSIQYDRSAEESKYDGEFSGSVIEVTNGELNENNPFKQIKYQDLKYDLRFLSRTPSGICRLKTDNSSSINYFQSNEDLQNIDGSLEDLTVNTLFTDSFGDIEYTASYDNTIESVSRTSINENYILDIYQFIPTGNYKDVTIEANNIEINTNQDGELGACTASVDLKVVFCELDSNSLNTVTTVLGKTLTELNKFDSFDISPFFTENRNTDSNYYIESYNTGDTGDNIHLGEIEFKSNVNLPNNDTSSIQTSLIDNVDPNCNTPSNIDYTTCPLYTDNTNNNLISASYQFENTTKNIQVYNISYIFDIPDSIDTTYNYTEGGTVYLSSQHQTLTDAFNDNTVGSEKTYTGGFGPGTSLTVQTDGYYKVLFATGNAYRYINFVIEVDNSFNIVNLYLDQNTVNNFGEIPLYYLFRIFHLDTNSNRTYLLTDNGTNSTFYRITDPIWKEEGVGYDSNKNLTITSTNVPYKSEFTIPNNYNDFFNLKLIGEDLLNGTVKELYPLTGTPSIQPPSPDVLSDRAGGDVDNIKIEFKALLDSGCERLEVQDLFIEDASTPPTLVTLTVNETPTTDNSDYKESVFILTLDPTINTGESVTYTFEIQSIFTSDTSTTNQYTEYFFIVDGTQVFSQQNNNDGQSENLVEDIDVVVGSNQTLEISVVSSAQGTVLNETATQAIVRINEANFTENKELTRDLPDTIINLSTKSVEGGSQ